MYALKEDNDTLVQKLLREGVDPNLAMPEEDYICGAQHPLMAAARQKNPITLQLLIDHGLKIEGPAPLRAALYKNHSLRPAFARLSYKKTEKELKQLFAQWEDYIHIRTVATMKLLLKYGADIHGDDRGSTPLLMTIQEDATDITRLFLAHHEKNKLSNTHLIPALHTAIACHNNTLVSLLIKCGADPLAIYDNETGLSRATLEQKQLEQKDIAIKNAQASNKKILRLLINNGAKLEYY